MKKRHIFKGYWFGVILSLLIPTIGFAENNASLFSTFTDTFDGYLKNETAVRLNEFDRFTKIENSLALKYSKSFGEYMKTSVTGLAVYDAVYDVEDDLQVNDEDEYRAYLELREAVVNLTLGQVDLSLGKQQVVWGKTDDFRVMDVANPLDYREFILNDMVDYRIPLWMGVAEYYFSTDFSLQVLVIPDMQFVELAHTGSEYELSVQKPPTGLRSEIRKTKKPEESFKNTEYGLKFAGFYQGWGFTLNYLYTWDDEPAVKKSFNLATGTLIIAPEHERMHVAGFTFDNTFWDTVVRGEFAVKIGKYYSVDDIQVPDMVVKKTMLNYALALEREFFDISWTLQFLQETILDYEKTITTDQGDIKLTLRGAENFRNDTLTVAMAAIYGVNEGEWLIRPSVEYAITDSIKIKGGSDIFAGGNKISLFGQFDRKDRVYAELKYSF